MGERFDVIVVGGGITGLGIARDLSMRGLNLLLLERNDVASGATGRSHGLLHSGARYVVKDPESAVECARENLILRGIAGHVIEETGGLFIRTRSDPVDYVDKFEVSCRRTGVKCERLTKGEIIELEPNLRKDNLETGYFVNDAAVDPFKLTLLNMFDAINNGASILTYHEVVDFIVKKNQVIGVKVLDKIRRASKVFHADIIVNASGAWSGLLGKRLGLEIPTKPNKGSLIVFSRRIFNMVINRLRPPSDGDIFVPSYSTTILGTTSIEVSNPDDFIATDEELLTLYREGSELYRDIMDTRPIRFFAGPRPLIGGWGREAKRTFTIIDHEREDDLIGLITIGGGKLTTYRLMAEKLSDIVAEKLGVSKNCRTHKEPLPGYYDVITLSKFLKKRDVPKSLLLRSIRRWGDLSVSHKLYQGSIICFCEQVTSEEIAYSISKAGAKTIGDVMGRTRASMGPCHGQNCVFKIAGILLDTYSDYENIVEEDLISHLRRRWRNTVTIAFENLAAQNLLLVSIFNMLGNLDHVARFLDKENKESTSDGSEEN